MRHVRNPLLLTTCLALTCVVPAFQPAAIAQIPTFDDGPPPLAPGTDLALASLIKDLEGTLKGTPRHTEGNWSALSRDARAALVFRRAALALAIRADALGQQGNHHALAARALSNAATRANTLTLRIDESLIDHAAAAITQPWPDAPTDLCNELRTRLGIFVTGDTASIRWPGDDPASPSRSSPITTGVSAIDQALRAVEYSFTPTLPLLAFAPARNHTRGLLYRAALHANCETGLNSAALTTFHSRLTNILTDLAQNPFQTEDLDTLLRSADLVVTLWPKASIGATSPTIYSSLSANERDSMTRFVLGSGPAIMSADRTETILRWHLAMQRLATASGKPGSMPPPLRQLDKLISTRAVAAGKDSLRGFTDLFRVQASPRDPSVLAALAALSTAEADLAALEHLRTLFSAPGRAGDIWDTAFPLVATRFTKLGVEAQNPATREAALSTLRTLASGTALLDECADLNTRAPLQDPSSLASWQRINTVAAALLTRKKSLLNQKGDPNPSSLAALNTQLKDLRALAEPLHQSLLLYDAATTDASRSRAHLHLSESAWQQLITRTRATINTADAMLDQWAKGTAPSTAALRTLSDDLSIPAALGRAIPYKGARSTDPIYSLLCGPMPSEISQNTAHIAALLRTLEALFAADAARDTESVKALRTLAHSAAARVGDVPNSKLHMPNPK